MNCVRERGPVRAGPAILQGALGTNSINAVGSNQAISINPTGSGYLNVGGNGVYTGQLFQNGNIAINANAGGSVFISSASGVTSISQGLAVAGATALNTAVAWVSASTSGSASFVEPFNGSAYKRVNIYCAAALGTASYTFPTPFINTPVVITTSGPASSVVTSLSTTAVTVTGATTTGPIFIEGQ